MASGLQFYYLKNVFLVGEVIILDARSKHRIYANISNVEYFTIQFKSTPNILTINLHPLYCRQLI